MRLHQEVAQEGLRHVRVRGDRGEGRCRRLHLGYPGLVLRDNVTDRADFERDGVPLCDRLRLLGAPRKDLQPFSLRA